MRRLWRRGRVGRERGIAGGLDGEARSAFGEQELAVNNHHPRVSTNVAGTPAPHPSTKKKEKGIHARHKLLPPRSHSRPRPPDFRSGLFGCERKPLVFVSFYGQHPPPPLERAGAPGERARSRWIDAPWAVVLSQTRSHPSLSAFGAAAKRMLTGLALRWLWTLDIDMRLLWEDIEKTREIAECVRVRTSTEFEARFLGWASSGGTRKNQQRYIWTRKSVKWYFYLYMYSSTTG